MGRPLHVLTGMLRYLCSLKQVGYIYDTQSSAKEEYFLWICADVNQHQLDMINIARGCDRIISLYYIYNRSIGLYYYKSDANVLLSQMLED